MKIIGVGMNYSSHKEDMNNKLRAKEPTLFMKSDSSSLLKDGKPFYIPDFSQDVQYEAEIVIKISRLGKNIAQRFAYRYYDEVTVGIDMTAQDLQQKLRSEGLPWEISKAFDNSAIIGTFVPLNEEKENVNNLSFHLDIE
jgi:2-keto-4-pentenoate hydratase/2-oxohepta-3-ene-1,7-dioic acid hydratase in catechol pathway